MFTKKHQETLDAAGLDLKSFDIGQLLALVQAIMAFIASLHKTPAKLGKKLVLAFCLLFLSAPAYADSSVRVEHHMPNGTMGVGTGTVVSVESGEALIITNRHVCPDAGRQIVVRWDDGKSAYAKWMGCDAQADLCALLVSAPVDCDVSPVAKSAPQQGCAVAFRGYRGGFHPLKRLGRFLGFGGLVGNDPVVMLSVPSISGDSGSGVTNDAGELVAVVWGGTNGRAHCVGHASLVKFLSSLNKSNSTAYADAYNRARAEGKRLVVFCGKYTAHQVPGCVVCEEEDFFGMTSGVVVGVPANGGMSRFDLPAGATDAQIMAVAHPAATYAAFRPMTFGCANGRCGR